MDTSDSRVLEWLLGGGVAGLIAIIVTLLQVSRRQGEWVGAVTEQQRTLASEMVSLRLIVHEFTIEMRSWITNHTRDSIDLDRRLSRVEARQQAVFKRLSKETEPEE